MSERCCRRCGATLTTGLVATGRRACCLNATPIVGVCPTHGPLGPHHATTDPTSAADDATDADDVTGPDDPTSAADDATDADDTTDADDPEAMVRPHTTLFR